MAVANPLPGTGFFMDLRRLAGRMTLQEELLLSLRFTQMLKKVEASEIQPIQA